MTSSRDVLKRLVRRTDQKSGVRAWQAPNVVNFASVPRTRHAVPPTFDTPPVEVARLHKGLLPNMPLAFLRQCLTETDPTQVHKIQKYFDIFREVADEMGVGLSIDPIAYHRDNFKKAFSDGTGQLFDAKAFWEFRLARLMQSQIFLAVRLDGQFSESTAVEVGYYVGYLAAQGVANPWSRVFYFTEPNTEIKTTMLHNANIFGVDLSTSDSEEELKEYLRNNVFAPHLLYQQSFREPVARLERARMQRGPGG